LTFGVLFKHSFQLLDRWGSIADMILYDNDHFSSEYFPHIDSGNPATKLLLSHEFGHSISLSANNLVYTHVLQTEKQEEKDLFEKRINELIVPRIIEDNSLVTGRLGVVYKCAITIAAREAFAAKVFAPEFKAISDFRFSKKESTFKGSNLAENDTYINKIYTVGSVENMNYITFDFQKHFNPPLAYVNNELNNFFSISKTYLSNEILCLGE